MQNLFFDLIKVAIGVRSDISKSISANEWQGLYDMAYKQAILGVCFYGVQDLRKKKSASVQFLPNSLFSKWLGQVVKIQQKNELIDKLSANVWKRLEDAGLRAAILKGQGLCLLYGNLASLRQSGDIDIWVKGGFDTVNRFVQSTCPTSDFAYHRFHYNIFNGIEVELHHRPTLMRNLFDNSRLQAWCDSIPFDSFVMTNKGFLMPSIHFNRIFILTHIYRHFLFEGIGMRQIMDYYFVLKAESLSQSERDDIMILLKRFRLERFASAMMWIMQEVFELNSNYLLCCPNRQEGLFVLYEVMQTANFGQGDTRYTGYSTIKRMSCHGKHLLFHYPSEVICTPMWLLFHKIWRMTKNIKACVK